MLYTKKCETCMQKQMESVVNFFPPSKRAEVKSRIDQIRQSWNEEELTPPEMAMQITVAAFEGSENHDPYRNEKKRADEEMLEMLPRFEEYVFSSSDPLSAALKLSALGNSIDHGISGHSFDISGFLSEIQNLDFSVDARKSFLGKLEKAKNLLFCFDNAGEVVADLLLMEALLKSYPELQITGVTRGKPILNDVLLSDIEHLPFPEGVRLISNGLALPSIPREGEGSEPFEEAFSAADVILAKGQGNFETQRRDRNLFHLFRAKCDVVSAELGTNLGGLIFYERIV